jgi:uncharacterized protein YndB with AHSA1/START domain
MPADPKAASRSGFHLDRHTNTIRFIRVFAAPRVNLFAAWTRPDQVTQWWDATGEPLTACEIDLRPGGAFRFTTRSHPEMPFAGIYREIVPPDHLVFEAMGSTGRVAFREVAGQTEMTVEIVCRSAEHLEQVLSMGVATGTSQTLDHLVAFARRTMRPSP